MIDRFEITHSRDNKGRTVVKTIDPKTGIVVEVRGVSAGEIYCMEPIPVAFVLDDICDKDFDARLCCPICDGKDQGMHLNTVKVEQGHTTAWCHSDKTIVSQYGRSGTDRGSEIELWMECEYGHEFVYVFSFHKGAVRVRLAGHSGSFGAPHNEMWEDNRGGDARRSRELWRD